MISFILNNKYLILEGALYQIILLVVLMTFLFFIFEILPLLFGIKNSIKNNLMGFLKYQIIRGMYILLLGVFFVILFSYLKINTGLISLIHLSDFSQFIILFFLIELTIYIFHLLSHKYKVPILSKAHSFHHTITTDMEWVNSRKEHYFVLSLFTFVFCLFFYVIFKSSTISHLTVIATYFILNAFSHYRLPVSLPIADQVFLFPKDHLRHHTERSGPYGVTLSLFDTIFNTRK